MLNVLNWVTTQWTRRYSEASHEVRMPLYKSERVARPIGIQHQVLQ